ncbi:MAG: carboxymuconolactone decarboxylase family protein [Syntrophomonas sp.]|uniref:carboxymuconolactone decarboxylase family protein n=1 Tax=Syntrophomonas sp. TaxID=2053627 RepID=UPI002638E66C|nr:carboxymuconolactone decarboxylase family protein [Syntrophomonas sp.]MDD2510350.1 carboxymuconolactone decarboxylase family protein [Syntrophomonas sp.]MDD3878860.1 carboxymuconolactone decarboxylase family protein [Syntrophomonas sp.]MDD4626731.1 carboxymuconolactone decarboxylase family protein [Syntrophomonas sp.]
MTTGLPWFVQQYKEKDPEYFALLEGSLNGAVNTELLDAKTRCLILLALDVLKGAAEGVKVLSRQAREAGAAEEEIREAVRLAYFVNSMDIIKTAVNAF